ncbi:hypothetical protein BH23ACT11_BH23ACT11_23190 [soil metagenome]
MTQIVERVDKQTSLPESWLVCKLADLAEFSKNKAAPDKLDANTRYIGLEHIEKDTGSLLDYGTSAEVRSTKSCFKEGELLYGKLRPYLNKVHVAEFEGICSTDILVLRTLGGVHAKYLHYRLLSKDFVRYANKNVSGVQHPRVNARIVSQFDVELPPLNEQCRIVKKIEELFTKLDAGVHSLEQARAQLKSYRRSVLKAAVEGELSREWREAHRDELEPASELLDRILQERRESFASKKYKEPASPETEESPGLPDGWAWAKADQLFNFVTSGSRGWAKYYSDEGPISLRIGNLDHDSIALDLRDIQHVQPPEGAEGIRTRVISDDVLISITADIGMVAVIPPDFKEAYINQHIALARPSQRMNIKYLAWYLASEPGNKQLTGRQYGATKPGLNLEDVRSVAVPVPPLKEQRFIVEEVERRLSVVDKLEATIEENLKQAAGLRQSILKQAFSGELVPQDPDDEPASVLLARIRSEREATKPKAKRPRKVREGDEAQGRLI